ncbi:MAG: hypothetical protein ACREDO_07265 [Methyloceanibacter sp.]
MKIHVAFAGLVVAFASTVTLAGGAWAETYSKIVQQNCRADYKKYCSEYGLESAALRNCMDKAGNSLSKSCVRALVQSGEVSQAEVNRRKRQ